MHMASAKGWPAEARRRLAERKGFEPRKPFDFTVFKTAALNHSAISPLGRFINDYRLVLTRRACSVDTRARCESRDRREAP